MYHPDDFTTGLQDGLRLAKRIYYGNDRSVAAPKPITPMEKATRSLYPTSPMVYAVIYDPAIVDNPDMPSYQPHVHGRCDPPALIPLQMNGISFEIDCCLDTAFVTMSGSWRVHCVTGNACCGCRVAVPMGEEGSILGAEVEVARKTYSTELAPVPVDVNGENENESESVLEAEDGGLLKPHIFTLTVPQVDGGSILSVKVRWTQKVVYKNGEFVLNVPYSFPEYVTPASKKLPKFEKIQLNVNCGVSDAIACNTTSHPLKERKAGPGKLNLLYEAQVITWSSIDFVFKYHASIPNPFGRVLLKPPSTQSTDQSEMFSLYLFAGPDKRRKVFRKEVVFVVDISESMKGNTIEVTKNALIAALTKLDQDDSFSIMAFNDQTHLYSSTLELATHESLKKANEWINTQFVASGGTNMSLALDQALEMLSLSVTNKSIPMVFFITDGAVENERQICEVMQKQQNIKGSDQFPRINTFGVGSFCNHYFLRMLAMMSKGHYDASYDADSIETQMQIWVSKATSSIMTNIVIDCPDDLEIFPSTIPDLCYDRPLIISGRYKGNFPDKLEAKGTLADMSNFIIDIEVQHTQDIPLEKVLAKKQIEAYTTQAWLSQDKSLEDKVTKISLQTGTVSEYTQMILLKTEPQVKPSKTGKKQGKKEPDQEILKTERINVLRQLAIGFGDMVATFENIPPGFGPRPPSQTDKFVKGAGNCCLDLLSKCCCMCCIQACSKINNGCSVVLTQICGVLTCTACCE